MASPLIEFSADEPAINVYSAKVCFLPHTDKEALKILMNLSSKDSYGGGGTGFWSTSDKIKGRQRRGLLIKVHNQEQSGAIKQRRAGMARSHDRCQGG